MVFSYTIRLDVAYWLSSLVVHSVAHGGNERSWFWTEVEYEPKELAGVTRHIPAGLPRLVRGLLHRVPCHDSLAELSNEPIVLGQDRVDDLIDLLCDPDRRLPSVVASAHPDVEFEAWRSRVTDATRNLPGLASIYLLDPPATLTFGSEIGRSHAVWGGAVRTYLPDVDPAVAEEAHRHRILATPRLMTNPGQAAAILSVLPRRLAAEAPLPRQLAGIHRVLLTQADLDAGTASIASLQANMDKLVKERELAIQLAEVEEGKSNEFFKQRERALNELAERDQHVLELENKVRWLQRQLVDDGRGAAAYSLPEPAEVSPPGTFAELLDWIGGDFDRIDFTGSREEMLGLDRHPEASSWVRSSWEVLRALQSYAETSKASSFKGDFRQWCENPPSGSYAVPAGKVVRDESETVKHHTYWRREREFPVPAEVDESKRLFMGSHVRIGASANGRFNPRLYFHDATAVNGKIIVGYLGRHLTNTQS